MTAVAVATRAAAVTPRSSPGTGASSTSYATPRSRRTAVDGSINFVNLDVAKHDVTAVDKGPDGKPLFKTPR